MHSLHLHLPIQAMAGKVSQQRILAAPRPNSSMDPSVRKQPKPPTATSTAIATVTYTSASHHQTPTKLDPTMAYTSSISNLDNLSKSHPGSRFQRSPKPNDPRPPSPKVDFFSSLSKPQPKTVGPRTVEKVEKKAKETCDDKPEKSSIEFNTEKFNDSQERLESMINGLTAKDKEIKELLRGHAYPSRRLSVSLSSRSGRRRSIGGSQIELAEVFANNGVKVVSADMPPFMQIHAVDCARKAHDSMEKFTSKSLALSLKKEFDGVYGPAWHCIVGRSFGSFVTHSVGGFLYFSMAQKLYILLFKTTVQRAD